MGLIEAGLYVVAAALLGCAWIARLRAYRTWLLGAFVLALSSALLRRHDAVNGALAAIGGVSRVGVPEELIGIAWWILGAWLVRRLLTLVLRRTLFPNDNQPHSRRLFADLASVLVYVVAFVGIMDTVLKEPISTALATSGVVAVVLGLALQNTLSDVFSGLAINIEQPFGAGDWITLADHVEGQVIEINWRATRMRTEANDLVVIPNSLIAKAIVTNHRRLNAARLCSVRLKIDQAILPGRIIELLKAASAGCPGVAHGTAPTVRACAFVDSLIAYEIDYGVDDFESAAEIQSALIERVTEGLHVAGIAIGSTIIDVRLAVGAHPIAPSPTRADDAEPSSVPA
jgi:small-conductance mechanosensitive channel